jgi:hypothetical protein
MLLAVDAGRLFFTYIAVNNAAREGAAYAGMHAADNSVSLSDYEDAVRNTALQEANVQGQGGEGSATVADPVCFAATSGSVLDCQLASDFAGGTGNQVTVAVTQPFTFLTPVIGSLLGGSVDLVASATAPVMNPPEANILPGPTVPPLPTPTPTATPTPTPTPTATPTLPPGATPTPTPTPTPVPTPPTCVVPNFIGGYWENVGGILATEVWASRGFTGTLIDRVQKQQIVRQQLTAGTTVLCTSSMWVDKN